MPHPRVTCVSFNVYLQRLNESEVTSLTKEDVRRLLPLVDNPYTVGSLRLDFGDGPCTDFFFSESDSDPPTIRSICVHRPVDDPRLSSGLREIMDRGPMVLYFPDCKGPLVTRLDYVSRVQKELVEALGIPFVIGTGAEIMEMIKAS